MSNIEKQFANVRFIDSLNGDDNFFHRLDTRVLLLTTFVYIMAIVSFDRYSISNLIPFFIYPFLLIQMGGLSTSYLFKRILWVLPFAVMVGIFNPFFDQTTMMKIGSVQISGGMISFFSIIVRFFLTASIAIIIVSLVGIEKICLAFYKLKVPKAFVIQILFLYRYIFVLSAEASKMIRAYSCRSFDHKRMNFKNFIMLIGHLLIRTFDRAERIYLAMCSRGFDGQIKIVQETTIGTREVLFLCGWPLLFIIFRFINVSTYIGQIWTGLFL